MILQGEDAIGMPSRLLPPAVKMNCGNCMMMMMMMMMVMIVMMLLCWKNDLGNSNTLPCSSVISFF